VASFPDSEATVLNTVRQSGKSRIVAILLQQESCTFRELVRLCERAPSTVSSHLATLKKNGIVKAVYGKPLSFRISSEETARIIRKHMKTLSGISELA
jgi:DeoR/GlpR family transcriptional regulator of sugar metabolism